MSNFSHVENDARNLKFLLSIYTGPLQPAASYTSSTDFLVLEDESGRVNLAGKEEGHLPVGKFCTGLVIAVMGHAEGGSFVVEDWCTAGIPPHPQPPADLETPGASDEGPQYVLLASGFELSESSDLLPLQMLIDYVGGHLGGASDQQGVSK